MIFAHFEMIKDAVRSIGHLFRALFCKSVYYYRGLRMCDKDREIWCEWQFCPKRKGGTENE